MIEPMIGHVGSGVTMFLLRSAFWLVIAFAVIRPVGFDISTATQSLAGSALDGGRSIAVRAMDQLDCETAECAGALLVTSAALEYADHSIVLGPPEAIILNAPMPLPRLQRNS